MAGRVAGATASDLMDFLQKTRKKTPEDENPSNGNPGSTFASVLAQFINQSSESTITSSYRNDASKTTSNNFGDLSRYVNQSEGYKEFRDKITSYSLDWYSDDMIDPVRGVLNQKGLDYMYQNRLDMAKSILPNSIEECDSLYSSSKENLENYTTGLLEQNGIKALLNLMNTWNPAGYNVWGIHAYYDGYSSEMEGKFRAMTKSDAGKEVTAMSEEYNLYRSISTLAENNASFRDAYNANPEAAVDKYFRQIGRVMDTVEMPRIDTMPDKGYLPPHGIFSPNGSIDETLLNSNR